MTTDDPVILSADDDDCADLLMSTVFQRSGLVQPIRFVRNGVEAIAYLQGEGVYRDRAQFPLPTALLLDLNMPRKDGFAVLSWIRQQPVLKRLQVFVLSGSSRPEDIQRAYDLGANAFLVKPGNLAGLMALANALIAWIKLSHYSPLNDNAADISPKIDLPGRAVASPDPALSRQQHQGDSGD